MLLDYEQRTAWKYESIRGSFHTAASLSNKVNSDGSYASYPGSTVVFRPGKQCLQVVQMMQKVLLYKLKDSNMLAAPLPASTIHMTLHDLVSPELCKDEADYKNKLVTSTGKAVAVVNSIRKEYAGRKITLVADRIVNMASKSLVLLLKPRTEEEYGLLLEMYHRFDAVQDLPYPLIPHITLAYFKPGMLDGDWLGESLDFAQINPAKAPKFEFDPESLTVQVFQDMQTYIDIPKRICFCCDGGLNRSVMAAAIVNHLANEKGLHVIGEARSAYQNTQGWPVPKQVRETLKKHGIQADESFSTAHYLEDEEVSHFSSFAAISRGAMDRLSLLGLPEEKVKESQFFFGVRDPEYGEISYEQAFKELHEKAVGYLNTFESNRN